MTVSFALSQKMKRKKEKKQINKENENRIYTYSWK